MVGIATDPVFGRVLSFGAGGIAVELLRDNVIGLPPLNDVLAQDMIGRTRISRILDAYRQVPAADRAAIVDALMRVSDMACALPWLSELDINPLLADDSGCVALDARVVVDPAHLRADDRYGHLAIRPYPAHLARRVTLAGGEVVRVRPIRPEDAAMERDFVEHRLSDPSRHMRFLGAVRALTPKMLIRLTQIDYDRELALIALPAEGDERMVGVARFYPSPDGMSCEFAVAVDDAWRNRGLGKMLLIQLMTAAGVTGYRRMTGSVSPGNDRMLDLARELGFEIPASRTGVDAIEITRKLN